jgi:hypothetical protein
VREQVDYWYSASVNVFSMTMTPENITDALGLAPSSTNRLGEPVATRRPDGPTVERHRWSLHSPLGDDEPLHAHVAALLNVLAPVGDRFRDLTVDCETELLVGLSARPLGRIHDFDAATVQQIAQLGMSIRLDVYNEMEPTDQ